MFLYRRGGFNNGLGFRSKLASSLASPDEVWPGIEAIGATNPSPNTFLHCMAFPPSSFLLLNAWDV